MGQHAARRYCHADISTTEQTIADEAPRRGPGRPTRPQIEARNRELLERSLDLFLERGFDRTTIEAITASVGMAKRTVYARYGDKSTLFKAALERAIEDWIIPIDSLRAMEVDDLEDTLMRIARVLIDNILSPAGLRLLRITNAESYHHQDIGIYAVLQGTERTLAYLTDLFARRLPARDEKFDDTGLAQVFLNLIVAGPATMSAWGINYEPDSIARHVDHSVRIFLRGVLPR
jgi:TetR/AcrR family transcriptional repressor of mexJK operon